MAAGCSSDDFENITENKDSTTQDGVNLDSTDTLDGESCNLEACESVYTTFVNLSFETPSGNPYCGDVTMTRKEDGESVETTCNYQDGEMIGARDMPCHVNPEEGETTEITFETPDYSTVTREITLPCECHPDKDVKIQLEN